MHAPAEAADAVRVRHAVGDGTGAGSRGGPVCRRLGKGVGRQRADPAAPPGVRRAGGSPELHGPVGNPPPQRGFAAEGALPLAENLRSRQPPHDPVRGVAGRRVLRLDHEAHEFDVPEELVRRPAARADRVLGQAAFPPHPVRERGNPGGIRMTLAPHPLGKGRRHPVGVPGGDALDGGIAGHGARIAARRPVLVAPLGRPDGHQLHFPGLGGTVGLLAGATRGLGLAHRHAGAVQSNIQRLRPWRLRIDHRQFVAGDRSPQRLGMALRLLGAHLKTGQLAQQGAGMTEACLPGRDAHHAPHRPATARRSQDQAPGRAD